MNKHLLREINDKKKGGALSNAGSAAMEQAVWGGELGEPGD